MNALRELFHDNSPQDWALALLAIAVCMLIMHTVRGVALGRLRKLATNTDLAAIGLLAEIVAATRILLSAAIAVYVATRFLSLPASFDQAADRMFVALLLLQAGLWANRGLEFWLARHFATAGSGDEGSRAMTRSLLSFLGRVVLSAVVLLLILDNMGLNVTALVASLGIGGVAVALAVQNILGDLFASLSIAIDKPFVIGDFIIVDELMGTVEHVGLKTTRIRSLSGEQIVFSNNDLLRSRIRNYKRMQERRALFMIGVTYETPAETLEIIPDLIREAVEAQPGLRFDRAHFKSFGASSLDFETVYFVEEPDMQRYMDAQQAINLHLVRVFQAHGIEFAFPTQTLHLGGNLQLAHRESENRRTPVPRRA
ncbi:mechanosensitive ion channel family protein [Aromatoleum petrolei]|uniref:Mechanosensitive ion channel n=1 Tax=Aromatoleum petrolei TaxID=76116 RepID=A0ABX1MK21_9RHOO|nr:mechanosensitive ion channel family protein [Aromatoleum petrolei]NMF88312.1 mechanosensitive ion channel [Aromatoleum petrolei]QTQ37990.1 MscS family mechanosensitive ion channel protein [Aromatoleum petrolei]